MKRFALPLAILAFILPLATTLPLTPRASPTLRILPLGDSITWGWLNGRGTNGYREQLLTDLTSSNYTIDYVGTQTSGSMPDNDNHGFPGYTILQIQGVAAAGLAFAPNVVLIHAGTNDLNRGNPASEPDSEAPRRLGGLLDEVLAVVPEAVVLVAQIIPAKGVDLAAKIVAFNEAVPGVVAERVSKGAKVAVVDMNVLGLDELSDDLHPNEVGYAHMGDIWNEGINAQADKISAPF